MLIMHFKHVHVDLEQINIIHDLEIIFRLSNCIYERERKRKCRKDASSRERFKHDHVKMQLINILVQIRVCKTVLKKLSDNKFIKVTESESRLKIVT